MQFIKSAIAVLIFVAPFMPQAQSTYLPQGSKDEILLERLEIKAQGDSVLNFSQIKPFSRKHWVQSLDRLEKDANGLRLSSVDRYNIQRARMNNLEWVTGDKSVYRSKKPLWNTFFKTPANFIEVDRSDFFLSVNPILQINYINDSQSEELNYLNTRGFVARGLIAKKIGFHTYLTENQERPPVFVQEWMAKYRAVPGAGFYKSFKGTGKDYFDARGSVTFNAAKFLDIQFGYDRQFFGNGYRSLYLSDFSNNHLFFNLNLKVWKLNYVSKVMELTSQYSRMGKDTIFPKKYMAIHHISFNAPKWLTLGLFEGIVFGREGHFEFGYLNPIIFLRPMEQQMGSPDNAFVGLDFKANIAKRFQLYGQVLFDEFNLGELRKGNGSWVNKWALQAGLKHVDMFGVKNLDLQLEANLVRPFMYAHYDTVANYTHYNQPLAHPLLSNFQEFIGILRYQPSPKWYMQARMNYWIGGSDRNGENWGNNIFLDYRTRASDYGNDFGSADKTKWMNANFWVAYELFENFFMEGNAYLRKAPAKDLNIIGSLGIRWNMHRRQYDY